MKVRFKRFSTLGCTPQKATIGSACYDLFPAKPVVLEPNSTRSVETDIGFCFSIKYVTNIYSRSSLSLRSIHIGGGIIDPDFRGNTGVIMSNFSSNRLEFNVVDRIAQVLFQKKRGPRFY